MTQLPIRIYPDPILRVPAQEVTNFGSELQQLVTDMFETMYVERGIGLAAPQIGVSQRIAVVDISEDMSEKLVLINPQITSATGSTSSEEGCLSIPGYRDTLKRASSIVVRAVDPSGTPFEIAADGLLSFCLQHEIDHLDGVLFVDRLSRLKRTLFKRWAQKRGTLDDAD